MSYSSERTVRVSRGSRHLRGSQILCRRRMSSKEETVNRVSTVGTGIDDGDTSL